MKWITTIGFSILSLTTLAQTTENPKPAEETEMHVDLPDETEETSVIEKGNMQLETQLLYNKFENGDQSFIGQALLRIGLFKNVEGRILMEDGKGRDKYIEETVQSTFPLAASLKVAVLKDHSWLPDITLVGYLQLPFTARSKEQSIYWSPIFITAFQNKIGEKLNLDYNIGIQQEAYSTQWVWLANSTLHYKIIEHLELFAEYYAQYAPFMEPQHNIGCGVAYQPGKHFEFYVSSGTAIFSNDDNHFFSGGVAYRLSE